MTVRPECSRVNFFLHFSACVVKYADLLHYEDMSAPTENTESESLVIGEFPAVYANALRADAHAQGVTMDELCAEILRGHVARRKEGQEG